MSISSFSGKYTFLSNFSPSSSIIWDNRKWKTVEHLFQARKTNNREDQEKIRRASTPSKAKRLGRKVLLRDDWEEIKYDVMLDCVRLKFKDKQLEAKLINTWPHNLIEGNGWHDNIWGNCVCPKCKNTKGKNALGEILMQTRAKILQSQ
jgi:ribA/ribD-fused uncharacterized protein